MNLFYHRLSIISFVLVCVLAGAVYGRPYSDLEVIVTRDLTGAEQATREDYLRRFPERELDIYAVRGAPVHRDPSGRVVVVVNTGLYATLSERFDRYIGDLSDEGYDVVQLILEGGTPRQLKDLVIEEGGDELVGTVMAGELPLAWYEHREYFYNENEPDNNRIVDYPIDLFFMDIDGVWEDTTGNGIYDHHHGDWEPDIWFGRMPGYNLSRIDEDTLMASYLDRVHAYRDREISLPHRALNYVDDDWRNSEVDWTGDIRRAYGWILAEAHPESTSAVGYMDRLMDEYGYELVQVAVHSTADSHLFFINNRREYDYFRFRHLREQLTPNVMFYNLFACSGMSLERNLCLGALYALRGPYGLGAVGTSKTGSMLFFEDYYRRLDEGRHFGEALRLWLTEHGREPGHENWARSWFYGMTHFGDPTLTLYRGLRATDYMLDDSEEGDGDSRPDASETADLSLQVTNRGEMDYTDVEVELSTDDPFIELLETEAFVESVPSGESALALGGKIRVGRDSPNAHLAAIDVHMIPEDGEEWWDRFEVQIFSPKLEPVGYGFDEAEGDGDGWTEAGESGTISVRMLNSGGDDVRENGFLRLESLDGFLDAVDSSEIPHVGVGETIDTPARLVHITAEAEGESAIYVRTAVEIDGVERGSGVFALPIVSDFRFEDEFREEPVWALDYPVREGYRNVWRWGEDAGEEGGGFAFGGPDTTDYPARADAAFELPLMMVDEDAVLTMRHRMDVETNYDAGVVEVDRGNGWTRIAPEGGYNGTSVGNGSFEGGDCWNGTFEWTEATVPLGGPAGPLRVRLRFASDGGVEGDGWYIDRLRIDATPLEVRNELPMPNEFALGKVYPNPFNGRFTVQYSLPKPGRAHLRLMDVRGRTVLNLFNSNQQAGRHIQTFSADVIASGIYLLKLEAPGAVGTRKVAVLK